MPYQPFVQHSQRIRDEATALGILALGLVGIAKQRQQAIEVAVEAATSLLFYLGGIGASFSYGVLIPFLITLLLIGVKAEGAFSANFFTGTLLGSVFYYFGFIASVSFFIVSSLTVVLYARTSSPAKKHQQSDRSGTFQPHDD